MQVKNKVYILQTKHRHRHSDVPLVLYATFVSNTEPPKFVQELLNKNGHELREVTPYRYPENANDWDKMVREELHLDD